MTRQEQWLYLDKFRRKLTLKTQVKKKVSKLLKVNKSLTHSQQLFYSLHTSLVSRQGTLAKVRNRCVRTGRSRNVLKSISSSRFVFRSLANQSSLPTVRRYSR